MRPLPINERLAMIDADGVAADSLRPLSAPLATTVDFLHECTMAYHRYFEDYVSAAPFRFTGSTVANLICGIETVLEEIEDAYKHGLRAISFRVRYLCLRANSRPITRATTTRVGSAGRAKNGGNLPRRIWS